MLKVSRLPEEGRLKNEKALEKVSGRMDANQASRVAAFRANKAKLMGHTNKFKAPTKQESPSIFIDRQYCWLGGLAIRIDNYCLHTCF